MSNGFSAADMTTARAKGYRDASEGAALEAVALIENARAATDFSTNYATAKPDIGNTEAEHILGLCRVVTGLISHIEAAPVAAAPTTEDSSAVRASTPAAPGIDPEALDRLRNLAAYAGEGGYPSMGGDIKALLSAFDASPKGGSGDQLGDVVEGMSVSVDVDRIFNADGRRLFGTVTAVQYDGDEKDGLTLLVQDAEPNWEDGPKGGSGEPKIWGTQIPGSMPKPFGARHIAELNWYPGEGYDLVCMQVMERIQATSAGVES